MDVIFFIVVVIIGVFLYEKARSAAYNALNYNKSVFQNNLPEKKKNVFQKFFRIFATWVEG